MEAILPEDHRVVVFSLRTGAELATRVCKLLGVSCGHHEERGFEDGEHKIRPLETVRGRDVYVVESLCGDDQLSGDEKLVRVLFFLSALRDAGARRLTFVAPYLCYARKDMRTKARDPVTTRYVASLLEAARIDRVVVVDVHNVAAYQNAFRVPAEHLSAIPAFARALAAMVGDDELAVVSPDAGGVKRADYLRRTLERQLRRQVGFAFIEKFRSEGVVRHGAVAGQVEGRVAVIVDDLISSGATLAYAARACRERGARSAYAAVTHGVFSPGASAVLREGALEQLLLLDTIPIRGIDPEVAQTRLQVLDCAPLLAMAIHRLHTDGSLVDLG